MTDIRTRLTEALEEHFVVMSKCPEDAQEQWDDAVDALLSLPDIYTGQDVANAYQQGYRDCIIEANRLAGHDLWLSK